jgi:pimeloyl-ACP methyl ester carboxylesterase
MGKENVEEFGAAAAGEDAMRAILERAAAGLAAVTAEDIAAAFGDLVSEVDTASLSGEFAEYVAESFREAVRESLWGWFDDDLAFLRHWGFEFGEIDVPVTIWQGAQDRMVPFAHGEWLAAHVAARGRSSCPSTAICRSWSTRSR